MVGAGPAGLAAAYRLAARSAGSVTLLDRAPAPGGLAAGLRRDGYVLDFGPHRLHPSTHPEVLADLVRLLGPELVRRPRRGLIRLGDRYLPYPLGPRALAGIGPRRALRYAGGLLGARFNRAPEAPASYQAAVEARLGRPLEESLEDCANPMSSPDFSGAVMAIRIQREVGGNLAELLLTVADTMVQRERLRRDVAALTAEGKISAIVLGILPVGIGGAMYVINPGYINVLFNERLGNFMLGGAVLLASGGFFWMKKTIEIEV